MKYSTFEYYVVAVNVKTGQERKVSDVFPLKVHANLWIEYRRDCPDLLPDETHYRIKKELVK